MSHCEHSRGTCGQRCLQQTSYTKSIDSNHWVMPVRAYMHAVQHVRGQATAAREHDRPCHGLLCKGVQCARTSRKYGKGSIAPLLSGAHMLIAAHDPSATAQHGTALRHKDPLFHLLL